MMRHMTSWETCPSTEVSLIEGGGAGARMPTAQHDTDSWLRMEITMSISRLALPRLVSERSSQGWRLCSGMMMAGMKSTTTMSGSSGLKLSRQTKLKKFQPQQFKNLQRSNSTLRWQHHSMQILPHLAACRH